MLFAKPTLLLVAALQSVAPQAETANPAAPGAGARAHPASPPPAPTTHDGSRLQLDVANPWVEEAGIRIDGRLDDAAWGNAPVLHGFTQFDPVEGVEASQPTRVRMLVTDEAVYFAVEAMDADPDGIRATLSERDRFGGSDDYVRLLLDTFDDQRRAFVFQVNPLGVQGDGLWVEGQGGWGDPIDWSPDLLWESSSRIGPDGWVAELRIPLKSLRFPDRAVQDWGLQVTRTLQRTGFESSWAPIDGSQANRLAQMGRLSGLRDLDPGLFLEINPVVIGSRAGGLDDDGAFGRDPAAGDFGLNVTYGLTSNLTLDGTYNPDFSQVEADAGQITVNERFSLYLSEQRPFFLEGADVFDMPQRLVYTRSIVQPVGAAKLSGKVGGTQVAYLGAVDDGGADATNPVVNLLRVKRDVGASSAVGAVYTDRTVPGERFNRVVGADGRFVFAGRYTLEVLAAGSADGATDTRTAWGSLVSASFDRASRKVELSASFEDVSPEFQARSGFIRRVGTTQARFETGYDFRGGQGALLERWGPSVEMRGYWSREDFWAGRGPEESEVELQLSSSFRGNVSASLSWVRSGFSFDEGDNEGLFLGGGAEPVRVDRGLFSGMDRLRFRGRVSTWQKVHFGVSGSWGEQPVFSGALGVPLEPADALRVEADVSFQPTGSFSADASVRHLRLSRRRDGSRYSTATIPRLEARYQFSRALFVRTTGEYGSQTRAHQRDPVAGRAVSYCGEDGCEALAGSDNHDHAVEGLLGYEPSPGTVFFLGYSRQMRDTFGFRFQDLRTEADGLFVKLSWRFRM